jgi:hypothetical protein
MESEKKHYPHWWMRFVDSDRPALLAKRHPNGLGAAKLQIATPDTHPANLALRKPSQSQVQRSNHTDL